MRTSGFSWRKMMMNELDKKVLDACHRIEDLYHETDGKCYVSFSGGKDSTVLLALIKLCEEVYTIPEGGIPAVFVNTGIELDVTANFVKWVKNNWYSNVITIRPEKSFDWVLKEKGKPVRSKSRAECLSRWQRGSRTDSLYRYFIIGETVQGAGANQTKLADRDMHMIHDDFPIMASSQCCKWMKKKPFEQFAKENNYEGQYIGLRQDEGGVRSINAQVRLKQNGKLCTYTRNGKVFKAPIIDWRDKDIDEFIRRYDVPLSDAYKKYGLKRTGCMACPFSLRNRENLEYLFNHEPNRYKAAMHWLKDVYIAQNVILPFDEAYERERENVAYQVRTDAAGNVEKIQTKQLLSEGTRPVVLI